MVTADFHIHSKHSTDGKSTLREHIEQALLKGLDTICFTEHYDYGNHNASHPLFLEEYNISPDEASKSFIADVPPYIAEVLDLKEEYKNRISIRLGLELGLQPEIPEYFIKFAGEHPFDFLIGSSHECGALDPYYPDYLTGRTPMEAYRAYFTEEAHMAKNAPQAFDVYGHADYALRYNRPEGFEFHYSDFYDELDDFLKTIIENGKGIEVNTGGFRFFGSEPNPRIEILKRYKELGGEIITFGSDAHHCSELARHFDKAAEILLALGYKYYFVFNERKGDARLL